ncbi:C-factor-like isoform X1 [Pristis pectinata]|uniref:C-factor-like isoform X1 n=1 Tax=Pristis pectinata TaxID=685728 RepID=UPI00223E0C2B|nr:C-factor-like isoform X1 [Pristis pectinata]
MQRAVLVTGASRGLGLELIRQLGRAERPPRYLFAACRDPEGARGRDLKNFAKCFSNIKIVKMDLDDFDSIQESAEEIQKVLKNNGLNLLINNAGINLGGGLNEITPEIMMKTYTINVIGPMMVTKALLPALLQAAQLSDEPGFSSKKAAVINMSSIMASMELFNIQHGKTYAYRISKAALNMVTKCLANELKPHGILCASVHPGWVRTDMGGEKAPLTKEESVQGILKVLSRLSEQDNGLFLDWRGQLLPW